MPKAKKPLKGDTVLGVRIQHQTLAEIKEAMKVTKQTRNGFIVAAVRQKLAEFTAAA